MIFFINEVLQTWSRDYDVIVVVALIVMMRILLLLLLLLLLLIDVILSQVINHLDANHNINVINCNNTTDNIIRGIRHAIQTEDRDVFLSLNHDWLDEILVNNKRVHVTCITCLLYTSPSPRDS